MDSIDLTFMTKNNTISLELHPSLELSNEMIAGFDWKNKTYYIG